MKSTSPYLEKKIREGGIVSMQVVLVDIVSYSRRKSRVQVEVIRNFMDIVKAARLETAKQYMEKASTARVDIIRDVIVLPSGDGAVVAFPFDFAQDMHMFFLRELLKKTAEVNRGFACEAFSKQGWCDCHHGFVMRYATADDNVVDAEFKEVKTI